MFVHACVRVKNCMISIICKMLMPLKTCLTFESLGRLSCMHAIIIFAKNGTCKTEVGTQHSNETDVDHVHGTQIISHATKSRTSFMISDQL